jgi:FkbM family methyltransferase
MNPLRVLAERLLRDRTRIRRMPDEFGKLPIIVSSAGGLRLLFTPMAKVDPDLFATAKALVRPGATVWDIGANIGLFSIAVAARTGASGHVVAFEPDTTLVELLRKTAVLQPPGGAKLTIVPCGVTGSTGFRSFVIAERARASNTLSEYGNSQMGGAREKQLIACFAPDDCLTLLPTPDVVKIDVEGAEIELLSSAEKLLSQVRPAIACEVAPQNAGAVAEILHRHRFRLFDASRPLSSDAEIALAAWNTIALPSERADAFF